jgi:Leucine-rich repeat (LRR) protein
VLTKNDHQKKSLKMTEMNITNDSLRIIEEHSKWIKNIKSLIISDNNVSEMDVVFTVCKNLEKLNISKNRFSMLRFIVAAPSLVELDASENSIEKIVNFYNIRKIETLNLKSNKIECLTRWVEKKKEKVRSSETIETEILSCDSIP